MSSHRFPLLRKVFCLTILISLYLPNIARGSQYPEPVDLGLSVKWADRNLDVMSPVTPGLPLAWGELQYPGSFSKFTPEYYKWSKDMNPLPRTASQMTEEIQKISVCDPVHPFDYRLKKEYDPCSNFRKGWRLPTLEEWNELRQKCKFEWVKDKICDYVKVTGPNGNSILLPMAGRVTGADDAYWKGKKIIESKRERENKYGYYWTSDAKFDISSRSKSGIICVGIYYTYFRKEKNNTVHNYYSEHGLPWDGLYIRAVYDPSLVDGNDHNNNDDHRINPNPEPGPKPKPDPAPVVDKTKAQLTVIGWSESTHSPKVILQVGVKSPSAISTTAVYVNGQQMRGIKAVGNDGYDMMIRQEITLSEGSNTVRVDVTNAGGTSSVSRQVFYMPVRNEDEDNAPELRKVAFVIGNSAYPGNELPNPKNDAADISAKLRKLGFDVTTLTDGTRRQIEEGISTFARKASDADVAMFFYAGHGIQYQGANYLIPVDAQLRSAKDIDYECTDVNRLLANLEESGCKMNIIALDACRNNPFERGWYRGGGSKGLSAINAPIGTFISYATSPGSVASDGTDRNSPYTSALLKTLDRAGLTIEGVFKNVGAEVVKATERRQTPWYSSSIYQGEFIFNPEK